MTRRATWLGVFLVAATLSMPRAAAAFEFFDGRLQIHGFGESIVRVLNNNFEYANDLSAMQFVLNLEAELDIAPDGIGPFNALSAYTRIEVRYDCIWRNACWLSPNGMDHIGDRMKSLPNWRTDGRESKLTGTTFGNPQAEKFHIFGTGATGKRRTLKISQGLFKTAFEGKGPDQVLGTADDPAPLIMGNLANYQHAIREVPGAENGQGIAIQLPLRPKDKIEDGNASNGRFRFHPNSLSPLEDDAACAATAAQPPAGCKFGFVQVADPFVGGYPAPPGLKHLLPGVAPGDIVLDPENFKIYRPYPTYTATQAAKMGLPIWEASGLYLPSKNLSNFLKDENISSFDQDFNATSLSWNHGASQKEERELKEFYFDLEMMDGRLWIRAGKQTIVWGKTEIFRSQDQFNPQDVGLATLPSLEESRIGLWALRGVWSFYDIGPMQDVRLEAAVLLDEFEPVDLGRCGEPYAPRPAFGKCLGIVAHSAVGIGLGGEVRPPTWWDDSRGVEFGARLEWRWRRFSFALTDYYGFNDFPHTTIINKYSRNVDPVSGRPRWGQTEEDCDPTRNLTRGCLGATISDGDPFMTEMAGFNPKNPNTWATDELAEIQNFRTQRARKRGFKDSNRRDILTDHPANQTFFNFACAASVGFTDIIEDAVTECGFNIFGSGKVLDTGFTPPFDFIPIVGGLAMIFGGSSTLYDLAIGFLSPEAAGLLTVVPLNHNDLGRRVCKGGIGTFGNPNCFSNDKGDAGPWGSGNGWNPASRTGEGAFGLYAVSGPQASLGLLYQTFGTVSSAFTPEQQALMGCGAYYATSCDRQGLDMLNAEASALFQAWPGFDGTPLNANNYTDKKSPTPGTVGFEGGPVCTRYERGKTFILPGCRGPGDKGYDAAVDGAPFFSEFLNNTPGVIAPAGDFIANSDLWNFNQLALKSGCDSILKGSVSGIGDPFTPANPGRLRDENIRLFNPINCQPFKSEMAAMSFNFLAVAILFSTDSDDDGFDDPEDFDEFNPEDAFNPKRCSLAAPQFCSVVRSLLGVTGVGRNHLRAGGNWNFGRRDFTWHGGQELALRYKRRNVLGFSTDFSEDMTKTNWGVEFTWISDVQFADRNEASGTVNADVYNLTVSVDRPTFINFLNANRTLLFNSQAFFSYVPEHSDGFSANGPYNMLLTFTVLTGYFQDRLFAAFTMVYDVMSESGAGLPALTYRFSERFSATFGMAFFYGRWQERDPFLMPASLGNRAGTGAYTDHVENGLAVVRDRDEFFFRVRYTF